MQGSKGPHWVSRFRGLKFSMCPEGPGISSFRHVRSRDREPFGLSVASETLVLTPEDQESIRTPRAAWESKQS